MTSTTQRIAALVADHDLTAGSSAQLEAILEALAQDPTAPTTVTDPERAVDAHLADSLDALIVGAVRSAGLIADIGAGAGIPGLVLAVALPGADVRLVESVGKKCEFIDRTTVSAGITNAHPVNARVEAWPEGIGVHDVVTARAVAPLGVLLEYAAPLLREGGSLVAWKARMDPAELGDAAVAADAVGMQAGEVHHQPRRPGADDRHLHVYLKVRATPERFPRRAGMARKRPISARFA